MRQSDFEEFTQMLEAVADYCGKKLSPGVVAIYWQGLCDIDLATFRHAINAHVQNPDTGQYMPKIADIRRMLGGTTKDAAILAWNKSQEAVGRCGSYRSVCFDDPIINRVLLDMGGWPALCSKPADELPFVERNFCDRYRAYKTHGAAPGHPPYLVGLSEAANAQSGFRSEPPFLIGNPDAAMAVMTCGSHVPLIPVTIGDQAKSASLRLIGGRKDAA